MCRRKIGDDSAVKIKNKKIISDLHLQSPISSVIFCRIQSDLRSPISNLQRHILLLRSSSPISNLQSRPVGEACQGGNRRPSKGMLLSFHTFKRISTLFSRHFAISSRRTRSLGAFGAKSTSPSPARDLEVPMSAAQDLYLQLKISEFCERCCVWKISDRHLRSPLNKSTGVP